MRVASMAGDVGDLVYFLPTLAHLGPVDLVLYPAPGKVREPFTAEKVERVRGLLELQPPVKRVRFGESPEGLLLDEWRKHIRRRANLSDTMATSFRVPIQPVEKPWLVVGEADERTRGKVVIHRSPRYQDRSFPWREVVSTFGADAVFVGSHDEHASFCSEFGRVERFNTPTLLDLARCIAGCRLFVGNQSTPRAIAEGLKRRVFVEESPFCPNTHFVRESAFYGRGRWEAVKLVWAASHRWE